MSYRRSTTEPPHVPETLWPVLRFGWPAHPIVEYPTLILRDAPLVYWRAQHLDGTSLTDASGNGHTALNTGNGVRQGRQAVVPSVAESGLYFDGSGAGLENSDIELNINTGDMVWTWWFQCDRATGGSTSVEYLYRKADSATGDNGMRARLLATGVLRVTFGTLTSLDHSATDWRDGRRHHVAVIADRSKSQTGWIVVDGVPSAALDLSGWTGDKSTADEAFVGRDFDGTSRFRGLLGEIAIFKHNLNTPETRLARHYAAGTTAPTGFIGDGSPTLVAAPDGFVVPATNAPTTAAGSGFTLSFVAVYSYAFGAYEQFILACDGEPYFGGCHLTVDSGRVLYREYTEGGSVSTLTASVSTAVGQTIRGAIVHQATAGSLLWYLNGNSIAPTQQGSGQVWTTAGSLTIGCHRETSPGEDFGANVWSRNAIRDVYWFSRPLTALEIRRLYEVTP